MFENHLLEEVFSNTLFEKLDFCSARKVFLNGKLHFFRTEELFFFNELFFIEQIDFEKTSFSVNNNSIVHSLFMSFERRDVSE